MDGYIEGSSSLAHSLIVEMLSERLLIRVLLQRMRSTHVWIVEWFLRIYYGRKGVEYCESIGFVALGLFFGAR
jgi:hypothetical protein